MDDRSENYVSCLTGCQQFQEKRWFSAWFMALFAVMKLRNIKFAHFLTKRLNYWNKYDDSCRLACTLLEKSRLCQNPETGNQSLFVPKNAHVCHRKVGRRQFSHHKPIITTFEWWGKILRVRERESEREITNYRSEIDKEQTSARHTINWDEKKDVNFRISLLSRGWRQRRCWGGFMFTEDWFSTI